MEPKYTVGKYFEYYEAIERLAKVPLDRTPSIKELDLSRAMTVSLYRSIERLDKMGIGVTVLEYLCIICVDYLGHLAKVADKPILDFLEEKGGEYPIEARNALRYLHNHPHYLLRGGEKDLEPYLRIAAMWFKLYNRKNGSH